METKQNPANSQSRDLGARKRIPFSVPSRKLEVPEIPGFHLHWFLDSNVPRALQAGYTAVDDRDLPVNQFGVANSRDVQGNDDLGSNIKIIGGVGSDSRAEYLNLMKIEEELWVQDQKVLEERNAGIMSAIFRDEQVAGSEKVSAADQKQTYVKTALFQRSTRKGAR